MCGIVAYVGESSCRDFIVEGLERLEYRGYDSAGFVCLNSKHGHLDFVKEVGCIANLKSALDGASFEGAIGMGHTRWATHGEPSIENAHPHFDCRKSVAVVHNGIVEDHSSLRKELTAAGHDFYSMTDTEVMAHLLEVALSKDNNLNQAAIQLASRLDGAFACVFILEKYPDTLLLMRRRSPLVIGVGKDEMFVASDYLAFSDRTQDVVFMPENSFGLVKRGSIELFGFDGSPLEVKK